ncbi:MAG: FHIPEP family type III secretion protein [Acidimicrobiales bacterium]|nr:FHIPEP family type III secretion protein [Acidimicrobiales bacterium]
MAAPSQSRLRGGFAVIGIPFLIVAVVLVMVVPLPPTAIDLLLSANLAIAVLIVVTAMVIREPLQFSVFPALLLVTTLIRLALNVSTTRSILGRGFAGHVVEAFGGFVVGGNIIIGLVIFMILVVIQFSVITAGAGRVAEVGARFTLDAMPGKQMAIDADLNAGLITEAEAKRRRKDVGREADFYGAMDGASKFVKGDAVAGLIIVAINLVGGIGVGVLQAGLGVGESMQRYSLLAVGDGLVSQIPALLISVASGIIVTRASSDGDEGLGGDLWRQLLQSRRVLGIAAAVMGSMALLPGLPKLPFLVIAIGLAVVASRRGPEQYRTADDEFDGAPAAVPTGSPAGDDADALASQLLVEPLELEIAPDLYDLVEGPGGGLLDRVKALRRQIARELGMVVPLVRTRDDISLNPSTYVIRVNGVEAGRGTAPPGQVLVLADGAALPIPGAPTTEPVYGLPAYWVTADLAGHLEAQGATVIDRGTVIVTHLADLVRRNAPELLTRQATQQLLDTAKEVAPAVVADIGQPDNLSLAEVQAVLRGLLAEQVPVRDLVTILETITARARETRVVEDLVSTARVALGPAISAQVADDKGILHVITLEPMLERHLLEAVQNGPGGSFLSVTPERIEDLLVSFDQTVVDVENLGITPTVIVSQQLRPLVRKLLAPSRPQLAVLAYPELAKNLHIEPVGVIDLERQDAPIQRVHH